MTDKSLIKIETIHLGVDNINRSKRFVKIA